MQEPIQAIPQDEDEISLVDLFVVVLKHRRLIVGISFLTALAAGVALFGLPLIGLGSGSSYTVQGTAVLSQIPPALKGELGLDPAAMAVAYSQEIPIVASTYLANGLQSNVEKKDIADRKFRTFIARDFIGKDYKVRVAGNAVQFELKAENAEEAKTFLLDIIKNANARVSAEVAKRSALIAASMESLYIDAPASTTLSDTARQLIVSSRTYMTGEIPMLIVSSEPEIFIDAQGRAKTALVAVMAALFLSVFLAFVLEYIERIKADPESASKIRKALGKS